MGTSGAISTSEQHSFLDLAKAFKWAEVKRCVGANPAFVNVQPCGRDGTMRWSALHQAAFGGSADAVQFLLQHGAALDAKTCDGQTPMDVAKNKHVRAVLRSLRRVPTPLRAIVASRKSSTK